MARFFSSASDFIQFSGVPELTADWSISCRLKRASNSIRRDVIWSRWTDSGNSRQLMFYYHFIGGDSNKLQIDIPWVAAILTGATIVTDTNWHQVGCSRSGNTWTIYLDGVNDGSTSNASAQETGADVFLGASPATGTDFLHGDQAELGAWDVPLDDAEWAALGKGVSPLLIRPQSLVFYDPIIGRTSPEPDLISGAVGTVTGTAASEHPRVYYPFSHELNKGFAEIPVVVGGGGVALEGIPFRGVGRLGSQG